MFVQWLVQHTMTSSNGNISRVTGSLCGEFTGHRWIPHTKASDAELWCFHWSVPWINGWVNNRQAGDLRRNRVHYDVIVMIFRQISRLSLAGSMLYFMLLHPLKKKFFQILVMMGFLSYRTWHVTVKCNVNLFKRDSVVFHWKNNLATANKSLSDDAVYAASVLFQTRLNQW